MRSFEELEGHLEAWMGEFEHLEDYGADEPQKEAVRGAIRHIRRRMLEHVSEEDLPEIPERML
ncbi:hypothetical protein K3722_00460 [Leisingera caerulea]|uniref:Uncharacterized protein n=1 Tax=Leisingera caerulea TaxID=506591 RepID=A0ABY5WWE9_LEICA|nr:hypothetical protein [Leisingera caerulea]UWQ58640.1 hypothetical protein K3722_00460 [Leisingera caerulea]